MENTEVRFHVWEIGTWSVKFSIGVQVKKDSSLMEVFLGPENSTVISQDKSLKVDSGPDEIGDQYSRWMLLDKNHFGLDGSECDKIGVGFKAFQNQADFCSQPFMHCLTKQLWNFEVPSPSPGHIIDIDTRTFEALTQSGVAKVKTKNIGKVEASYGLTFKCSIDIDSVLVCLWTGFLPVPNGTPPPQKPALEREGIAMVTNATSSTGMHGDMEHRVHNNKPA
ncbi:hypothetical protein EJB05_34713, partial [Eragrostis curvula]